MTPYIYQVQYQTKLKYVLEVRITVTSEEETVGDDQKDHKRGPHKGASETLLVFYLLTWVKSDVCVHFGMIYQANINIIYALYSKLYFNKEQINKGT